jgi:hypothetical protein
LFILRVNVYVRWDIRVDDVWYGSLPGVTTFVPEDLELALRLSTFEPVEVHFK